MILPLEVEHQTRQFSSPLCCTDQFWEGQKTSLAKKIINLKLIIIQEYKISENIHAIL